MSPDVATTPQRSAQLAQVRADRRGVLSVYADLDPTLFPTPKDRHTEADALTNEAKDRFVQGVDVGHDEHNRRFETIERLSDVLNDPDIAKGGTRTLAVFAAPAADVFERRSSRSVPTSWTTPSGIHRSHWVRYCGSSRRGLEPGLTRLPAEVAEPAAGPRAPALSR